MKEIPVYLFTGFLESGKTKFIQETLQDPRFNSGERTLLLVCEEGIEEYKPSLFSGKNVFIEILDGEDEFETGRLKQIADHCKCQRIIVEYNGMWLLNTLYEKMPQNWVVAQEFMFCDANTFLSYNTNMRQLVYDKLRSCELAVFNRCSEDTDRIAIHKIVRAANRRADIAYEALDGSVVYDDIEDPLPFDLNAPVVEIQDQDYALFYSDLSTDIQKYNGKTLRYKGMVVQSSKLPNDCFIFGRQMMTCCVDDIQFTGLVCIWPDAKSLKKGQWVTVTAKASVKWHKAYGKKGPVLTVVKIEPCEAPEQPVAAFY